MSHYPRPLRGLFFFWRVFCFVPSSPSRSGATTSDKTFTAHVHTSTSPAAQGTLALNSNSSSIAEQDVDKAANDQDAAPPGMANVHRVRQRVRRPVQRYGRIPLPL